MEKDKSIQNQKVFTSLDSVLELQREIERLCSVSAAPGTTSESFARGMYRAAQILKLPIALSASAESKVRR